MRRFVAEPPKNSFNYNEQTDSRAQLAVYVREFLSLLQLQKYLGSTFLPRNHQLACKPTHSFFLKVDPHILKAKGKPAVVTVFTSITQCGPSLVNAEIGAFYPS